MEGADEITILDVSATPEGRETAVETGTYMHTHTLTKKYTHLVTFIKSQYSITQIESTLQPFCSSLLSLSFPFYRNLHLLHFILLSLCSEACERSSVHSADGRRRSQFSRKRTEVTGIREVHRIST